MEHIGEKLMLFQPVSLAEMEKVHLMNRVDTKYTTSRELLISLLEEMTEAYNMQEIRGKRISHYQTIYWDTRELEMYFAHQNGRRTREKIRVRNYVDSGITFLEIKNKNNKGRTQKIRIPTSCRPNQLDEESIAFLQANAHYSPQQLHPHVQNHFNRITLVNKEQTERLTIDTDISFENRITGLTHVLPDLVIIELKQQGHAFSQAKRLLAELHIRPVSISKYCLGSILTHPGLKHNRFKSRIMQINKQINHSYGYTPGTNG
ncbi:MAG: polyphosphate polymerase domain-containing protein [Tannerellaceae bacterium]|nr:polyphosphate polymerase domain-containing protein [Tannerellaceae bacterium]